MIDLSENENSVLIKKKCSEIINKNKDLLILIEIVKIHQDETDDLKSSSIKHFPLEMLSSFKYVPIKSVLMRNKVFLHTNISQTAIII